jgi:hypothetical protein
MQTSVVRSVVVACLSLCAVSASGQEAARLTQLSQADLFSRFTDFQRAGVLPGDVLLENDRIAVIVKAVPERDEKAKSASARIGGVVVLGRPLNNDGRYRPEDVVTFVPGPASLWSKAEGGIASHVAVVRFRHAGADWSCDLSIRLYEDSPWVDIVTTYHNANKSRTLQAPLVDTLFSAVAKGTEEEGSGLVLAADCGAVALVPMREAMKVDDGKGVWRVGFESGDAKSPLVSRVSTRLRGFGRDPFHEPMEAGRQWGRKLKDKDDWFRVDSGESRSVHRRLVVGDDAGTVRVLALDAKTRPIPTTASSVARREESSAGSPQRIVGQLRQPAAPAAARTTSSGATAPRGSAIGVLSPASRRERSATPPAAAPRTIDLELPDLPPVEGDAVSTDEVNATSGADGDVKRHDPSRPPGETSSNPSKGGEQTGDSTTKGPATKPSPTPPADIPSTIEEISDLPPPTE